MSPLHIPHLHEQGKMARCRIKGTKTDKNHCFMNMKRTIILHKNTPAVRVPYSITFFFLLPFQSQFKEIINGECFAFFSGFCQNGFDFEGGAGPLGSELLNLPSLDPTSKHFSHPSPPSECSSVWGWGRGGWGQLVFRGT